jgi:hypothetical protein
MLSDSITLARLTGLHWHRASKLGVDSDSDETDGEDFDLSED